MGGGRGKTENKLGRMHGADNKFKKTSFKHKKS